MIVEKLTIQNFMCFVDEQVDFTKHKGVTLIEGKNGDGKTAIIEALAWCFFGKTIRKLPASDVMHENADGRTLVYARVRDGDRTFTIERSRLSGTPAVRILEDNEDSSNMAHHSVGVQERIEKMLGIDYNIFSTAVVFGTESFCEKTDSERKAMMEKLLGHSYYSKAEKLAKERRDEQIKKVQNVQGRIDIAVSSYEASESSIEGLLGDMEGYSRVIEEKLAKKRSEYNVIYWDWMETIDYVLDCKSWYRKEKEKSKNEYQNWIEDHKNLMQEYDEAKVEYIQIVEEGKHAVKELNTVKKELDRLNDEQHPDECPTCGQLWKQDSEGAKKVIEKQEKIVLEKEDTVARLRTEALKLQKVRDDKEIRVKKSEEKSVSAEVKKPDDMVEAERDMSDMKRELTSLGKSIAETKQELKTNPYIDAINRQLKQMEDSEDSLDSLSEEKEVLVEQEAYYAFWEESFNKKGLPSFMLDESIPILNEYSKKISDILSNGKIQVTFNSDGKKRAGNAKLDIEVHSTESGNSYLKSSKGERRRIDLCVTLALRELIARRSTKSFDQVFIDEVFDGMDEEGAESVVALLRKYYSNKRVFVITHDSTIKSLLNSDRIVAQKVKHNQSEIRQFIDTVTEGVASTPMTDIVTPQKKKKRRALAL